MSPMGHACPLMVSTHVITGIDPAGCALDGRTIWVRLFSLLGEMYVEDGSLELDGHAWDACRVHLGLVSLAT